MNYISFSILRICAILEDSLQAHGTLNIQRTGYQSIASMDSLQHWFELDPFAELFLQWNEMFNQESWTKSFKNITTGLVFTFNFHKVRFDYSWDLLRYFNILLNTFPEIISRAFKTKSAFIIQRRCGILYVRLQSTWFIKKRKEKSQGIVKDSLRFCTILLNRNKIGEKIRCCLSSWFGCRGEEVNVEVVVLVNSLAQDSWRSHWKRENFQEEEEEEEGT